MCTDPKASSVATLPALEPGMMVGSGLEEIFAHCRPRLFALAYRMLGSVAEAEDVVQEAFVRWQKAGDQSRIQSPEAFLTTVVTRLAINHLQSARVRREQYFGTWLPEPLVQPEGGDPDSTLAMSESLSMAFLVLLENLTPSERAVFLLHDVFDYEYGEIAEILGKSAVNCRQICHRARQNVAGRRARYEACSRRHQQLVNRFMQAASSSDMEGLLAVLAEDITLWSDGGGRQVAALRPITGANRVARFIGGALRKLVPAERSGRLAVINGQPGIINSIAGQAHSVLIFDIHADQIRNIYIVTNPEKLSQT